MPLKKQFAGTAVIAAIMYAALSLPPAAQAAALNVDAQDLAQSAVNNAAPERIDMQIKELHDQLHITPVQEHLWRDVAASMRITAKNARTKLTAQEDNENLTPDSAPEERDAHRDLQQVQYDGAKLLSDPFNRLYEEMSAEQKKNADEIFAHPRETVEANGTGTFHP